MMLQMGRLIRQQRKQQGKTQQELGEEIISKSVLSRIENGILEPDFFTLSELFQRLGNKLDYFEIIVSNTEYERIKRGDYPRPLLSTLIVAEGEYIKDIRKAKGLSQEQFSSDVCARETISNMEHGRTPQYKKIQKLMEKSGMPFEKYIGYVAALKYEVYELVEEYQICLGNQPEEAGKLRKKIAEQIDVTVPVNRQFLESSELMERMQKNQISSGEAMAGLERCLRYTMPEYDGSIYRIPYRQEVVILQNIVQCLSNLKRVGAAQSLADILEKKNNKKFKVS